MKLIDMLKIVIASMVLFCLILSIPGIQSEAVPSCQPHEWGALCQDYPDSLPGYEPIGTVVYFRIVGFDLNDPMRTDIGVIDAYWWDTTEQRYFYQLLTSPPDAQNPYTVTEYKIIPPEDVFNG